MNKLFSISTIGILSVISLTLVNRNMSPNIGDVLCWATPTQKTMKQCKDCPGSGVYAWHPYPSIARKTALEFCKDQFKGLCTLDYCEVVKKDPIMR